MSTLIATGATSAASRTSLGLSVVIGAFLSTNATLRPPLDVAASSTPPAVTLQLASNGDCAVAGPAAPLGFADAPSFARCPPASFHISITPSGLIMNSYPEVVAASRHPAPMRALPAALPSVPY